MRISEDEYWIIDKAEKITTTDYEIKWFDKDTFDGYIDDENLITIIDDLLSEIDYLNEKIDELQKPKEKDDEQERERQVLGL